MAEHKISLASMQADLDRVAVDPFANDGQGIVGRLPYPANLVPPTPMPNPAELAAKIQKLVMSNITTFASSYVGEKVGDLLTPPNIGDIMSKAGSFMGDYIKKPEEVMKELASPKEQCDEENLQNDILKNAGEMNDKVNKQVGDVKGKVDDIMSNAQEAIATITSNISKGPAWIEAQINAINSTAMSTIESQVDSRFQSLKQEKEEFINKQAQKIAKKQAEKANEKVFSKTFDMIKQPQQALAKAKTKAMSVAKDALLDMKATIGL